MLIERCRYCGCDLPQGHEVCNECFDDLFAHHIPTRKQTANVTAAIATLLQRWHVLTHSVVPMAHQARKWQAVDEAMQALEALIQEAGKHGMD